MQQLSTSSNMQNPDDFYADLLQAHVGLSEDQSASLNIKLVLLLANHIGDASVLKEALDVARKWQ
jgi:hypothetical protein